MLYCFTPFLFVSCAATFRRAFLRKTTVTTITLPLPLSLGAAVSLLRCRSYEAADFVCRPSPFFGVSLGLPK